MLTSYHQNTQSKVERLCEEHRDEAIADGPQKSDMRKYTLIFKTGLKQESKTTINTVVRSIGYIVMVYIFIQLWRHIYLDSGRDEVIPGYTFEMMIWYLIITEIIMCILQAKGITRPITDEIRSGKIAYHTVRPYNYFSYQVTNFFSIAAFRMTFLTLTGLIIGFAFIGALSTFTTYGILLGIVSLIIGVLLWVIIFTIIGMAAFWVENSVPYGWVVHKMFLMLVLFFPPEIFGNTIQTIIIYSPLNAAMAGPARLFVSFSFELFFQTLAIQLFYLITLLALGYYVYAKGAKKVNIYGG